MLNWILGVYFGVGLLISTVCAVCIYTDKSDKEPKVFIVPVLFIIVYLWPYLLFTALREKWWRK